jgi:PAS domain S-box-containing protein
MPDEKIGGKLHKSTEEPAFQTFAINIPGIVYRVYVSKGNRMKFFNDTLQQMTGYKASELKTGEVCSIDPIIISEDQGYVVRVLQDALRNNQPFEIEYRIRHKDGNIRYFLERGRPICGSDGKPEFIDGVILDVTERKQTEESLVFKNHIIKNSSSMIATCDLDGNMTYGNPAFLKKWGFDNPEEFLGRSFWEFWMVKDRLDEIMQALRGEGSWFGEIQAVRKDGTFFDVQVSAAMVFDSRGDPIALTSTSIDITERKQVEEALRESENKYRTIFNNIKDIIYTISFDRKICTLNQSVKQTTGWSAQELIGKETAFLIHPDDLDSANTQYDRFVSGENVGSAELRVLTKSGEYRTLEFVPSPLIENGKSVGILGIARDITDKKRAVEELRGAKEELGLRVQERTIELRQRAAQLARLSSELTLSEQRERRRLAEILHDHLQQLLVAAKINSEILFAQVPAENKHAAENVLNLVRQSIQTSRSLTTELSPPVLKQGSLSAALKWLARWMRETHGLTVELQIESDIKPQGEDIIILLFQSIRELLFNVVKHAGVKRARIEMSRSRKDQLRITVTDQGSGFNPETLWEKAQGGTGFGLFSISERLTLLGGSLEVESSPRSGSSFSLVVPLELSSTKEENPMQTI